MPLTRHTNWADEVEAEEENMRLDPEVRRQAREDATPFQLPKKTYKHILLHNKIIK